MKEVWVFTAPVFLKAKKQLFPDRAYTTVPVPDDGDVDAGAQSAAAKAGVRSTASGIRKIPLRTTETTEIPLMPRLACLGTLVRPVASSDLIALNCPPNIVE